VAGGGSFWPRGHVCLDGRSSRKCFVSRRVSSPLGPPSNSAFWCPGSMCLLSQASAGGSACQAWLVASTRPAANEMRRLGQICLESSFSELLELLADRQSQQTSTDETYNYKNTTRTTLRELVAMWETTAIRVGPCLISGFFARRCQPVQPPKLP
jgi:hypothetical protein